MPMENKKFTGLLNANQLRFLALLFMLMDHMWATVVSGQMWLTCVGRLAFPIFAFQISEGFVHTSNFKRYATRLLVFALISEIPFNLMLGGSPFFPFHQNVMFTLLLGLLAIRAIDNARKNPDGRSWAKAVLAVIGCLLLGLIGLVDYSATGVATVILFYLLRGFRGARIAQLLAMIVLNCYMITGMDIPFHLFGKEMFFPMQGFAVFSLVFIWLYNGKKGSSNKLIQYGNYAFYPVHMLILSAIALMR